MKYLRNSSPDGIHFLMEFFGCDSHQLNSIEFWKKLFLDAITRAEIKVLNKHSYQFSPYGTTGYLLLSASHISIHTWPEFEYAACDVFSCVAEDESMGIVRHSKKNLQYKKVKTKKIKRGFKVNPKELLISS